MPLLYSYSPKWELDEETGFLRAPARFLRSGVMEYGREELEEVPDYLGDDIVMLVAPDTVSNPDAARSLEGMPITMGHEWAGTDTGYRQIGSVAGTPRMDGGFLAGNVVITCPDAVKAIMSDQVGEISSAYRFIPIWEGGDYDGDRYDGKQTGLRFNHIAIIPYGTGRAGPDVRIMNKKKKEKPVSDECTRVELYPGHFVRVMNADMGNLDSAKGKMADDRKKSESQMESQMGAVLEEMKALKAKVDEMDKMKAEYEGKLMSYKEQLEKAMSPESVEAEAQKMYAEKDEASNVMTGAGYDKEKAMNSIKGLTGHPLRLHVVNSVRQKMSLAELSEEAQKNEGLVSGYYASYKELAPSAKSEPEKKSVSGAGIFSGSMVAAQNSAGVSSVYKAMNERKKACNAILFGDRAKGKE